LDLHDTLTRTRSTLQTIARSVPVGELAKFFAESSKFIGLTMLWHLIVERCMDKIISFGSLHSVQAYNSPFPQILSTIVC